MVLKFPLLGLEVGRLTTFYNNGYEALTLERKRYALADAYFAFKPEADSISLFKSYGPLLFWFSVNGIGDWTSI